MDKIVGPGNIFVATAKKQLYGVVDIDMIAGPSEILILADETAKPAFLAADLMSQAEHDKLASAILLTPSQELAEQTGKELEKQVQSLSRKEIIQASCGFRYDFSLPQHGRGVDFANELAPEHLGFAAPTRWSISAGWIMPARCSWEITARSLWGITLRDPITCCLPPALPGSFLRCLWTASLKKSSFIYYTENSLKEAKDDIVSIAQAEGLTAHAHSVEVRF